MYSVVASDCDLWIFSHPLGTCEQAWSLSKKRLKTANATIWRGPLSAISVRQSQFGSCSEVAYQDFFLINTNQYCSVSLCSRTSLISYPPHLCASVLLFRGFCVCFSACQRGFIDNFPHTKMLSFLGENAIYDIKLPRNHQECVGTCHLQVNHATCSECPNIPSWPMIVARWLINCSNREPDMAQQ